MAKNYNDYTEHEKQASSMLLRFLNMQAGTSLRVKNEWNQLRVLNALERAGGDVRAVKNHIREFCAKGGYYRGGYGHALAYDYNNEQMQELGKELFGANAIFFTAVGIMKKDTDHIKEVVTNGKSKN